MRKTCLFDLDGTLSDPKEGICKSVAYALDKFGIHITDLDTLNIFIGPPLLESFMEYYGFDEATAQQAITYYREYFKRKGMFENVLYPQVEDLLTCINKAGIDCIVATSKPESFAVEILQYFHIAHYFKDICGATMDGSIRKKGDVIAQAMKRNHVKREHTMMIGDRLHDIYGAKENGMMSIGVLYGYGDEIELKNAGADVIVSDIRELRDTILMHYQ